MDYKYQYNKEKHRQLLNYSEELKKQGKFISEESRKDFLENKISSFEFCERLDKNLELSEELSNILQFDSIHEKASKFSDFLDSVSISCEACDRSPEAFLLPGEIGETEFRKEVEEHFFELQKLLEE
jgi:hypothetical protein